MKYIFLSNSLIKYISQFNPFLFIVNTHLYTSIYNYSFNVTNAQWMHPTEITICIVDLMGQNPRNDRYKIHMNMISMYNPNLYV